MKVNEKHLVNLLTKEDIEKIHSASLDVLSRVGIRSESAAVLRIFNEKGAEVNSRDRIVRIPSYLVEEALKKTPRSFTLHGRSSEYNITLEQGRTYFGMGGSPPPHLADVETGKLRRAETKDVEDFARLGDALENISFIMSLGEAIDVPKETEFLHHLEILLNNTCKPIVFCAYGIEQAKVMVEMAATVAGGDEELRTRPILSLFLECPSPLLFYEANESMLEFAKAGLPIVIGQSPILGATAPVTIPGLQALANAENLAILTLAQLINPGTPVVHGIYTPPMDMRTCVVAYGGPERAVGLMISGQLARHYEIPSFSGACGTDSKLPDAQAGAEAAITAMAAALGGVNMVHNAGTIASGSAGSMTNLIICDEILGFIRKIMEGCEVEDETLAVDLICKVGPGGNFLSEEHTLHFFKKGAIYVPKLFDRQKAALWSGKDAHQLAKERVRQILRTHRPMPLPIETQRKLREIVAASDRRLGT